MMFWTTQQGFVGLLLLLLLQSTGTSAKEDEDRLPKRGNFVQQRRAPLGNRFRMAMFHSLLSRDGDNGSDEPYYGEFHKDKKSKAKQSRSKTKLKRKGSSSSYPTDKASNKVNKHTPTLSPVLDATVPTLPPPTADVPVLVVNGTTINATNETAAPFVSASVTPRPSAISPTYNYYSSNDEKHTQYYRSKAAKTTKGSRGSKGSSGFKNSKSSSGKGSKSSSTTSESSSSSSSSQDYKTLHPTIHPTEDSPTETVRIRVDSKLEFGFFAGTPGTQRPPTQEEIDGAVVQTTAFYTDVLNNAFSNFVSINVTFTGSEFDANKPIQPPSRLPQPLTITFDSNVFFEFEPFIPTEFEVYKAMEGGDYAQFITNYLWNSEPVGTSIFYNTQSALFTSPTFDSSTMAPNATVVPTSPPNATAAPTNVTTVPPNTTPPAMTVPPGTTPPNTTTTPQLINSTNSTTPPATTVPPARI